MHAVTAGAAVVVFTGVTTVLAVLDQREEADRESLRVASEALFEREAEADPQWRQAPAPAGRVWGVAKPKAVVHHLEMVGERAKVWADNVTTPYTTTPSGADPQPTTPYMSSHVFLFEPTGDGWRLAADLTEKEATT
ncbi:hypothetical protein ACF053_27525 [Streptomyces kanasensis]|uniref:hypothetical protein n=1 Tax=Streptomyces kanasensis TaxID=936756 RepID=UPI003700E2BF